MIDICQGIKNVILSNLQLILSLRGTRRYKSDGTFVSDGDLLCQKLIFEWLNDNLQNYVVFSEESINDINKIPEYKTIITVDPIDGTENYVSGLKEWGVGVSVYVDGKHHQSMILLPELNECLITGDKVEHFANSRICGLSSYMKSGDFTNLDSGVEYRIMGCCMYNMFNVIRGSYRRFEHRKGCYSWDILPGVNLAIEHGLSVLVDEIEYHGEFLLPGKKYHFIIENN